MGFIVVSFFAGVLTILAPCILSLLPIILGGTLTEKNPLRPLIIASSLGLSVLIFTLLLKATTLFIEIPDIFWQAVSGILVIFFGFSMLFPVVWEKVGFALGLYKAEGLLAKTKQTESFGSSVLLGAAMGPVFTTCSPTYLLIVATVLPAGFVTGLINLIAFIVGLMLMLLLVGYGGRAIVLKFRFAANPNGWFKRTLGAFLILTGILIITGFNKTLEGLILDTGYNGPIQIEKSLMESFSGENS